MPCGRPRPPSCPVPPSAKWGYCRGPSGTRELSGRHRAPGVCREWTPLAPRAQGTQPRAGLGPLCHPLGLAGRLTILTPTQTLYNKTSEALDHMLQSLLTQDPTTDELRLLLSVRAAGSEGQGEGHR